ncbi:DNA-binding response regulator, partial [Paenarthrobacter aurescens]|nr:DNA-binding response regulator [Paenarthrobacter aurescens]
RASSDFFVDLSCKKIVKYGSEVSLSPTVWNILELLFSNKGKLLSQQQNLKHGWGQPNAK